MSVRVMVKFARPSMRIANAVLDRDGRPIAGTGSELRDPLVRVLREIGVRTVVVEDSDDLAPWETLQDLDQQLAGVARRFGRAGEHPPDAPRTLLQDAITRHLTKESAEFEDLPADASEDTTR